jgi:hypothetical protein
MDTKTIICACVAGVVIIGLALWYKGYFGNKMSEGYLSSPMSSASGLVRSPVNYTYLGDGLSLYPQFRASPDDRTVPLEYSSGATGFDPYKRVVNKMQYAPLLKNEMKAVLPNDSKLRMDLVESGDFREFNILNNQFTPLHKQIPGNWTYDFDAAVEDPSQPPLYHPSYFRFSPLGF